MILMTEHIGGALIIAELKARDLRNRESNSIIHGHGKRPTEREMIAAETAVAILSSLHDSVKDL